MTATVIAGDCRLVLRELADASFDAIVSDPPYELGFMGRGWDSTGVAYDVALWREALRVLKPGGHLAAFGGTRTYHRLTCAIEDAGFEIRDGLSWLYGSGFPKSLDVSKAIDKADGAEREVVGFDAVAAAKANTRASGEMNGRYRQSTAANDNGATITAPATAEAQTWAGWGTALKPGWEPITLARKPLIGTVASNVLAHGTGALNIDGCRIGTESTLRPMGKAMTSAGLEGGGYGAGQRLDRVERAGIGGSDAGRWPANVLLSHDPECLDACAPACPVRLLDEQSGVSTSPSGEHVRRTALGRMNDDGWQPSETIARAFGDTGGASRFFYTSKASRAERDARLTGPKSVVGVWGGENDDLSEGKKSTVPRANHHPTVKPLDLMRWLCRLITPPGGTILDPFAGSGSTLIAALEEGFVPTGIELQPEYVAIIEGRLNGVQGGFAL